ncbi:ATP phosphoribosyltransferase, partial [Moorena sp. SIO3I6]|uniref:ATP phosphoribosyltransferase n=1 Tax=Moorena sp. SIO3I6 TaxID=2607831 RepID=UPI0025D03283
GKADATRTGRGVSNKRLNLGQSNCERYPRRARSVRRASGDIYLPAHGRVASKFVHCAREYFNNLDLPVEIIPLYGSVELGPITGMSEAIVDLVSTGRTLKENGLIEIDILYESTARLIAHPISYRLNTDGINNLIEQIRELTKVSAESLVS